MNSAPSSAPPPRDPDNGDQPTPMPRASTAPRANVVRRQKHRPPPSPSPSVSAKLPTLSTLLTDSVTTASQQEHWVSRLATPGLDSTQIRITDKRLGEGSFGQVWLGIYLGSPVAIKVCPLQRQPGVSVQHHKLTLEHFCREVARLQKIRHQAIISYFGVVFDEQVNHLYLVTELMKGGSLFHCLRQLRMAGFSKLSFLSVLKISLQIANGLFYLHRQNFTFGDLKSLNILVSAPPDVTTGAFAANVQVKLCDFGLSKNLTKLLQQLSHNMTLEGSNKINGTYAYLPPETFNASPAASSITTSDSEKDNQKQQIIDAKAADIYALSIVLWELATLQMPWKGKNPLQIVNMVGKEGKRPTWTQDALESIPEPFIQLTEMCWRQDPQQRPTAMYVAKHISGLLRTMDQLIEEKRRKMKEAQLRRKKSFDEKRDQIFAPSSSSQLIELSKKVNVKKEVSNCNEVVFEKDSRIRKQIDIICKQDSGDENGSGNSSKRTNSTLSEPDIQELTMSFGDGWTKDLAKVVDTSYTRKKPPRSPPSSALTPPSPSGNHRRHSLPSIAKSVTHGTLDEDAYMDAVVYIDDEESNNGDNEGGVAEEERSEQASTAGTREGKATSSPSPSSASTSPLIATLQVRTEDAGRLVANAVEVLSYNSSPSPRRRLSSPELLTPGPPQHRGMPVVGAMDSFLLPQSEKEDEQFGNTIVNNNNGNINSGVINKDNRDLDTLLDEELSDGEADTSILALYDDCKPNIIYNEPCSPAPGADPDPNPLAMLNIIDHSTAAEEGRRQQPGLDLDKQLAKSNEDGEGGGEGEGKKKEVQKKTCASPFTSNLSDITNKTSSQPSSNASSAAKLQRHYSLPHQALSDSLHEELSHLEKTPSQDL